VKPVSPEGADEAGYLIAVDAVGSGVSSLQVGQAVLVSARDLPVRGGCYTEAICVPASAAYALPAGVDFDQAVVLPTYLVAYAMLEMFETAQFLPVSVRAQLSGELVCYARTVINQEWPRMKSGTLGNLRNPWSLTMLHTLRTTEPRSAST
jgi:hypothetical protein